MVLSLTLEFSKLSLTTLIMALKPVSCYYMTSFIYGSKEERDVSLTCRCHLSNIMPDSIFYGSIGWEIILFYFILFIYLSFKKGNNHCLPQHIRNGFSCVIIITLMTLGKP